jgi:tetratricopeptide (TPR) repeat protein
MISSRLAASFIVLLATTAAQADQTDARLDELFAVMQQTSSAREAFEAEGKIWAIWLEYDNQQTQDRLTQGINEMDTDPAKALSIFNEVIETTPQFAEGWNKRATLHYLLGNYDASIADIEKTLALEPRHFGALSGLGLVYWVKGEYIKAKSAFEAVLVVHPRSNGARQNIEKLNQEIRRNSA